MADPQPNAAAVTPQTSGSAQPAAAPADDGFERVSRDEYQTLKRNNERLRGMEGFYQKAQQVGFKRPEDLDGYAKFNSALEKKGIKRDALMQALMAEEQQQTGEQSTAGVDFAEIEKRLSAKFMPVEKFESELNKRDAMYAHKSEFAKEQAMVQKHIDGLLEKLGDGASARDKALLPSAFKAMVNEKRGLYPEGHPLHDSELAVFDEKSLASLVSEFEKQLGLSEAAALAAAGDAVNKGGRRTPTVAGASGSSNNKPSKPEDSEFRSGGRPPKAEIEAAYAKKIARRGGGTVSSMGG